MTAGTPRTTPASQLRVVLVAEPAAAGLARRAVTRFARAHGAGASLLGDIQLAITEAVANAVVHAYREPAIPGHVTIAAERDGETLRLLVSDCGPGIAPRVDSPGLGLGLAIIGRLTQSLDVRDGAQGGAELHMTFALAGARTVSPAR